MKVLVTGGAGYIGSHVALDLLDQGRSVVIVDNLVTGSMKLVPEQASFVETDIADVDTMRQVMREHGVTSVVHCAGSTVVPESLEAPISYYSNNTVASLRLLDAMVAENVRHILFSSTAAVYKPDQDGPLDEGAIVDPLTPYGQSKRFTELMIQDVAAAHGLSYCILRYFNVAGADPHGRAGQVLPNATHLIKVAVQAATGKRDGMDIFGSDWPTRDGSCIRDFIHVSDLAEIHRIGIEYLESGRESTLLNCGYGIGFSVLEVVATVKRLSGCDFRASIVGPRPGDLGSVIANPQRLMSNFDWKPRFSDISVIVSDALEWEKSLETKEK